MAFRNLADFLDDLGRAGELAAVDAEVDPCLEVAEITRRIARQNGPALLFRNVKGHDIPLATNLFGTESRILRALGAESIEEATARIDRALNGGGPDGWLERLRFGGKGGAAASYAANRVKSGACQQVVRLGNDINLFELPLLKSSKGDSKPVIGSAIMLSAEPDTHAQVALRGNLVATGRDSAIVAWSDIADPARLFSAYSKQGARMPLAIVAGGDPTVNLAVAAPLPSAIDPLGLAGLLREKPLDAVACRSIDLFVPAEADFIIEGWIEPTKHALIGELMQSPRTQNYVAQGRNLMHVTAVTQRANGVIPAFASNECCVRDRYLAKLVLPYFKTRIPELIDFDLRLSATAPPLAILAIDKTYPSQPRHVATVAWSMRPFQSAQLLILVDAEIDVRDSEEVLAEIVLHADWKEDVFGFDGPDSGWRPKDRMAIDATRTFARSRDAETEALVTDRWAEYGLGPESEA